MEHGGFLRKSVGAWIRAPERYAAALACGTAALRSGRLWDARRLLARLPDLERFAYWQSDAWRDEPRVAARREAFLLAMRDLLVRHRNAPADPADRRRINHALSNLEFNLQIAEVECLPWRANLELTNQCNLRCPMCPQSFLEFPREYTDEAILEHVRPLFPWLELVDLTGFGEPLLSPLLPTLLGELRGHAHTRMITNGILLHDAAISAILEGGLCELNISIDAASRETYLRQRKADQFEPILANLRRMVEARKSFGSGRPKLGFNFVFMRGNGHELPELVRLAARLGVERVCPGYLSVYSAEMREESFFFDKPRANRILAEAARLAEREGVELLAPEPFAMTTPSAFPAPKNCRDPWEFLLVKSDAKVGSCCLSAEIFGNLRQESILDVWRSGAYADFRRRVNSDHAPLLCSSCVFGRETCIDDPAMHFYDEQVAAVLAEAASGS